MSAAHLGYVLAKRDYEGGKASFIHYLHRKVVGELKHVYQQERRHPGGMTEAGKRSFYDEPAGKMEYAELDPYGDGALASREDSPEGAIVDEIAFRQRLAVLSGRQRRAVEMRYLENMTLESIGQALGINGCSAFGLLQRALNKLRTAYEQEMAA
jgi:RNA polymerase sigma factor (sigma-70 family)